MTTQEKLKLIQRYSGLTQEQLAAKVGVTFVALNRWINAASKPRPKSQAKIDALYLEYSGEKVIPESVLQAKKHALEMRCKKYSNILQTILSRPDLRDQFDLSLTYHSNKIEGSTLSENETDAILFHNKVIPNKTLREQLEAKNHQTALHILLEHSRIGGAFDENFILRLHGVLMSGIHPDAGTYRRHPVRILGTRVVTANYIKIPDLMMSLCEKISAASEDIVAWVSEVHAQFEKIHPFGDGNGRMGRLLMTGMLLRHNFPPALIKNDDRQKYFVYLSRAQESGDSSLLQDFVCEAITEGFRIIYP